MFRCRLFFSLIVLSPLYISSSSAQAGMPSLDLIVTELGQRRLEEVSFFFVGFLLLTLLCQRLWNSLAKDIPSWPRLRYRGALSLMLLWGLALTVVLALISGAREIMTPAAWEPNGITHRLVSSTAEAAKDELADRRTRLLVLKSALWDFASQHDAHFPNHLNELDSNVTIAEPGSGLHYFLTPNLTTTTSRAVLISEPDLYARRLLLLTDGAIVVEARDSGRTP